MDLNKEISRKKFFGMIGIGAVAAFMLSSVPLKFAKSMVRNSKRKNIRVSIHPSAVKRTNKV